MYEVKAICISLNAFYSVMNLLWFNLVESYRWCKTTWYRLHEKRAWVFVRRFLDCTGKYIPLIQKLAVGNWRLQPNCSRKTVHKGWSQASLQKKSECKGRNKFNLYIPKYDEKEDINVLINDWLRILLKFIVLIKMAMCIYIIFF